MNTLDGGSRTERVFQTLRSQILRGEWEDGARLPPHLTLAASFEVAPLTMRHVLGRLERAGLVLRRQGSGTYVRLPVIDVVLVVDDDPDVALLLAEYVRAEGFRAHVAGGAEEGLAALECDPAIRLVFTDVWMPTADQGVAFIRAVRIRWPALALAAVTAFPDDLGPLRSTQEWPVLIVPKPFRAEQIRGVLRLVLPSPAPDLPPADQPPTAPP